jgi:hypothetical protein
MDNAYYDAYNNALEKTLVLREHLSIITRDGTNSMILCPCRPEHGCNLSRKGTDEVIYYRFLARMMQ